MNKFSKILCLLVLWTSFAHASMDVTKIEYAEQDFIATASTTLDNISNQYYEHATDKNKSLVIFTELGQQINSYADRIKLRTQVYQARNFSGFKLYVKDDFLYSVVIYPPNPSNGYPDTQIEISKGKNLDCGFIQYQYNEMISPQLSEQELIAYTNQQLNLMEQQQFDFSCGK